MDIAFALIILNHYLQPAIACKQCGKSQALTMYAYHVTTKSAFELAVKKITDTFNHTQSIS